MFGKKDGAMKLAEKNLKLDIIEAILNPVAREKGVFSFSNIARLAESLLATNSIYFKVMEYPAKRKNMVMSVMLPIVGRFWGCRNHGEHSSCQAGVKEQCFFEDLALCEKYCPDIGKPLPKDITLKGYAAACFWCGHKFDEHRKADKLANIFCDKCKDKLINNLQERAKEIMVALRAVQDMKIKIDEPMC